MSKVKDIGAIMDSIAERFNVDRELRDDEFTLEMYMDRHPKVTRPSADRALRNAVRDGELQKRLVSIKGKQCNAYSLAKGGK